MAFLVHRNLSRDYYPFEFILGTDAEAYTRGEILTLASGRLTKAGVDSTGTQKFLANNAQAAEATATTPISVMRLFDDVQYVTENPGSLTAADIGNVYTLNTDADGITTTTTNGVFELAEVFTLNDQNFVSGYLKVD